MPKQKRKNSIRKPGWDYRTTAYYFVTICTHKRLHLFEDLIDKEVVEITWNQIPRWPSCTHVTLDEFIVMPNHVHGLLFVDGSHLTEENLYVGRTILKPGELGSVVATFKGIVTHRLRCLERGDTSLTVWQRGYWDRIVRNEEELNRTRHYIRQNLIRWTEARDNLDAMLDRMQYHRG